MSELKHTPAPWAVDQHSLNIWQDSASGYQIGQVKRLGDEFETIANTKLIAAAPTMLNALMSTEPLLVLLTAIAPTTLDQIAIEALIKQVGAAIDKATK